MSEYFLKRYRKLNPDASMEPIELRQAIRVNTRKITDEELVRKLTKRGVKLERIPWISHGYYAEAEFSLGSTKEYLLGWYFIQGPLSQLACEVLSPKGDVLDMASAPGGKTTYLAQMTDGMVLAIDSQPMRLRTVVNNVERLGLTNVVTLKKDARFVSDLGKEFHSVLLDAPCSGNYCSEENWASKRTIDDIKRNSRLQRDLLKSAHSVLAKGGRMVYSTCSLEPEENEENIKWFLEELKDMHLVHWDNEIGTPSEYGTRFWPHETGCEGFFIAVLEKQL